MPFNLHIVKSFRNIILAYSPIKIAVVIYIPTLRLRKLLKNSSFSFFIMLTTL